jgi:predicted dehydrogenase
MKSRRQFLQKMSSSLAVLPFLPLQSFGSAAPDFLAENDKAYAAPVLRVAIMGLGGYANRVAEAMRACKKAKLMGLITGTPAKKNDWQTRFYIPENNCYNYADFDKIATNKDIDAVYVITPNGLHHDQVIRVANAGKHVICEKPMGVTAREAQEMVDVCKKKNVQLLVGYRMHFEPKTLEIIRMRKAGELGKTQFFQGQSGFVIGDPAQWRLNKKLSGGGAMMDIGIYSVNGMRYMLGEDPIWVTAQETKTDTVKFASGIDETIQFQCGFPSGALASCLSTYNMSYLDRFFLTGDKGFAELYPASGYGPIMGRTSKGELNFRHVPHQTVQMDEMADIILNGKQPIVPVNGEEAVKDAKIIDAIFQAAKEGKKIPINW